MTGSAQASVRGREAWRLGALALALSGAVTVRSVAQTATVGGSLLDRSSRTPVEGARISVLGTGLGTSTSETGRFELAGVPAGVRVLQIRAIGYAVGSWMVDLNEGQNLQQTFELDRRAVQLDTITIAAATSNDPNNWRSEAGFEQRRARLRGHFIGRQEIQQRQATSIGDLIRVVPGVTAQNCSARSCNLRMGRTNCQPEYFLDGYPATFATGPTFPIQQIRGVEVYRDRFEVPPEFQRINLTCGVIAIWTIEPGTPLERR